MLQQESLFVLEANLDDMSPQLVGVFIEDALARGALDAWATPIVMKKGRPGLCLHLLCRPESKERLREIFFRQTTSLGVRDYEVSRTSLAREWREVITEYGPIRVKLGLLNGDIVNAHPEFEDCRAASEKHNVAVKQISAMALALFWGSLASKK
jgi:uncharacterized protein (DUF111 family)